MSRYLEITSMLLAAGALAGCVSMAPRVGGRLLLGGYKLMSAPASEVPIGAEWRQGYGPIGPAASADNIITRRSFNSLTLSRAERRGLEIKLADYLGLEPSTSAKLSASVSEISIGSIKDFGKLGLKPGASFLSDAMKASKITVVTSSEGEIDLLTGLQGRGLQVSGGGSTDGQETITIDGADLFFAYRVIKLDKNDTRGGSLGRVIRRPHAPGW